MQVLKAWRCSSLHHINSIEVYVTRTWHTFLEPINATEHIPKDNHSCVRATRKHNLYYMFTLFECVLMTLAEVVYLKFGTLLCTVFYLLCNTFFFYLLSDNYKFWHFNVFNSFCHVWQNTNPVQLLHFVALNINIPDYAS